MKKLLLLILFVLNLVLLQAQEVKFISVNSADASLENITFKRLPKLLEKDSLTADSLITPEKWMVKLQKKLSKQQRQDSNIYIFFCSSETDSVKAFLPLSGKYGYVLFDTTKTSVVELEKVQKKLSTHKYQWDLIHDPENSLISFLQDEEEAAMYKSLEADYDYSNIGGHNEILQYLLNNKQDEMIDAIELSGYFEMDPETYELDTYAAGLIKDVLGYVVILDEAEAQVFVNEFYSNYCIKAIVENNKEILEQVLLNDNLTEDSWYEIVYPYIGYAATGADWFKNVYDYYYEMWAVYKDYDKTAISEFKLNVINSLEKGLKNYSYKNAGLKSIFSSMSNTKFKQLYRSKFSDVTNAEMKVVMESKSSYYDSLIETLTTSDKIDLTNSLDDYTLFSFRNVENFEFKSVNWSNYIEMTGNALTFLQLSDAIVGGIEVSPLDVFAAIPSPIAMLAVIGDHYVKGLVAEYNEIAWDGAGYSAVKDWNEKWRGIGGINDEGLYLYYTDQDSKYNPDIVPTSIVFTNKELAEEVMGFESIIVDCDYKSVMFNGETGYKEFNKIIIGW